MHPTSHVQCSPVPKGSRRAHLRANQLESASSDFVGSIDYSTALFTQNDTPLRTLSGRTDLSYSQNKQIPSECPIGSNRLRLVAEPFPRNQQMRSTAWAKADSVTRQHGEHA